jgi:hypothetical protein
MEFIQVKENESFREKKWLYNLHLYLGIGFDKE